MVHIKQWVKCGKKTCKSCPHGPYWYKYWYDAETKRHHSQYIGKELPGEQPHEPPKAAETTNKREEKLRHRLHAARFQALFNKRTCTEELCRDALGLGQHYTHEHLKAVWRELARKLHPDTGGDAEAFKVAGAAFSFLNARRPSHHQY